MQIRPVWTRPQPATTRAEAIQAADRLVGSGYGFEVETTNWLKLRSWQPADPEQTLTALSQAEAVRAVRNEKTFPVYSLEDVTELEALRIGDLEALPSPLLAGAVLLFRGTLREHGNPVDPYRAYNLLVGDPNHPPGELYLDHGSTPIPIRNARDLLSAAYAHSGYGDARDVHAAARHLRDLVALELLTAEQAWKAYPRAATPIYLHWRGLSLGQVNERSIDRPELVEEARRMKHLAGALADTFGQDASRYWTFVRTRRDPEDAVGALQLLGGRQDLLPLLQAMGGEKLMERAPAARAVLGLPVPPEEAYRHLPSDPEQQPAYLALLRAQAPARAAAELARNMTAEQTRRFERVAGGLEDARFALAALQLGKLEEHEHLLPGFAGLTLKDYATMAHHVPSGKERAYLHYLNCGENSDHAVTLARHLEPEHYELYAAVRDQNPHIVQRALREGHLARYGELLPRVDSMDRYEMMVELPPERAELYLSLPFEPATAARLAGTLTDPQQLVFRDLARHLEDPAGAAMLAQHLTPEEAGLCKSTGEELQKAGYPAASLLLAAVQAGRLAEDAPRLTRLGEPEHALERYEAMLQHPESPDLFLRVAAQVPPEEAATTWKALRTEERIRLWEELGRDTRLLEQIPDDYDLDRVRAAAARGPEPLQALVQAGLFGLGWVGAGGSFADLDKAARIAQHPDFPPLPPDRLGEALVHLGGTPEQAADAFCFLASRLPSPEEAALGAPFLRHLEETTGSPRQARLAFIDLSRREVSAEVGQRMLDALELVGDYGAARPVWAALEQGGSFDNAREPVTLLRERLTPVQRSQLLRHELQEPLPPSLWAPLVDLVPPKEAPHLTEILDMSYDPRLPVGERRRRLEGLKILSGGERLGQAWKAWPHLPPHLAPEELGPWALALRRLDKQPPELMAEIASRWKPGRNPAELATLLRERPLEEFHALIARIEAECGCEADPAEAIALLGYSVRQSGLPASAESTWELVSFPLREESLADRLRLFRQLAECTSLPSARELWKGLVGTTAVNGSALAALEAVVRLAPRHGKGNGLSFAVDVLRPIGREPLEERVRAAESLLEAVGGNGFAASTIWTRIASQLPPGQDFPAVVEALSPLAASIREDARVVCQLLTPVADEALARRVALYSDLYRRTGARAPELWEFVLQERGPGDDLAECMEAAGSLGDCQAPVPPPSSDGLAPRLRGWGEVIRLSSSPAMASRCWDTARHLRTEGLDGHAETAVAVAMLQRSLPGDWTWALTELSTIRQTRRITWQALVQTLFRVSLTRTDDDLRAAIRRLPEELPAAVGIEERGQKVVVGGVTLRKR